MRRALQLAANGRGFTSPNPMVGAVITGPDGQIIGEGWHRRYGGPHAEVNAVRSVSDKSLLSRSTIYVTLEPCSHFGKTPPCADMLVDMRLRRVVVGCTDPNEKVSGRGIRRLREAGIDVTVGVLEHECRRLNRVFMTAHTLHRPFVMLKWACSSDLYLDDDRRPGSPAPKFSTPQSLQTMHSLRACFDAIIAGSSTIINDNPRLDLRLCPGCAPRKVIVDRRHRLSPSCRVFNGEQPLYFSTKPLDGANCEWIACRADAGISEILDALHSRGISSLMVEGGPTLLRNFIDSGFWDEARIEISPVVLGARGRHRMAVPQGITSTEKAGANMIINVKNESPHAK